MSEIKKRKRLPRRKKSFEEAVLSKAMRESQQVDPTFFSSIMAVLSPQNVSALAPSSASSQEEDEAPMPPAKVMLYCNIQQTTGDVIEAGLRKKLGDDKEARQPGQHNIDLIFNNTKFEIKYKREGFKGLATDSQSLRRTSDKWYIYVKGDIQLGCNAGYDMWIIRSDKLYEAIEEERKLLNAPTIQIPAVYDDKMKEDLIKDILDQIHDIESELAKAVWNKASGDNVPVATMGLEKRIGLNRVRFDLKFESILRACVRETLRS